MSLITINNKLSLTVYLLTKTLGVSKDITEFQAQSTLVKASFQLRTNDMDEEVKNTYSIIANEIESHKLCSIMIYQDDKVIDQGIFNYYTDFHISKDCSFPMDPATLQIPTGFDVAKLCAKFSAHLETFQGLTTRRVTEQQYQSQEVRNPLNITPLNPYGTTPLASGEDLVPHRQPPPIINKPLADLPKFEDEYEIHRDSTISPFPGLSLNPAPAGSGPGSHNYGDDDLYPTGEKHPNLNDPLGMARQKPPQPPNIGGTGGMIFDPFHNKNNDNDNNNNNKGPGWIPGARFDDPYGRPPNPPSGGSGSGGFFNGFI
ncbi:hypothetical protein NCAS_0D04650 [Naumovozyma castellii]|uniref:PI31 proteasome regulator C-terminal domain-containing protein n=1 Tax=Naumovozyma castellii TaxID=27288 RepID=G0VEQ5_NAUCA|nr:hypothetical protein NCAS_0D04650 [Naumovozyma castellii CBS 4309]CCC70046.1 hypothetical protein NCAS_0D04650 [Naumovozyma castellii CBS 4309]